MKKTFYIPKNRLYSDVDYTAVLSSKTCAGFALEYEELQPVSFPSGSLCMFDAYSQFSSVRPYQNKFEGEGRPFALSVMTSAGPRVAFAGILFSDAPAAEWKLALFDDRDIVRLSGQTEGVTVSVSSGLSCIGDYLAMREYESLVKSSQLHPLDGEVKSDGFVRSRFVLPSGKAFGVFSGGWGEGAYSGWIGLSEGGEITAFLADFQMFERPKKADTVPIPVEADIGLEEMYRDDPKLSDSENHIGRWTMVIENAPAGDDASLFNAYSRRGFAYHSLKRYREALADYTRAIEIGHRMEVKTDFKFHAWTLYDNAGQIYRELGRTDEAVRIFRQALSYGDTFYAGAYTNLIDIYLAEKNLDEALAVAKLMVTDRPQDPNAYHRLAEIYVSLEDYGKAVACYDELITGFKLDECIFDKVACLSALSLYDQAKSCLEGYLDTNKPNELYYYNMGLIHVKTKKYEEGYGNLLRAYDLNPDYVPTLHLLIDLDDLMLNHRNIVRWAGKYIELRPANEFGYYVRATAFVSLKSYDDAIEDALYLYENISREPRYCAYLSYVYSKKGDFSRAKKYVKILRRDEPAACFNAWGNLLLARKKYLKAEKALSAAAAAQPDEQYLIDLADCLLAQNKPEQAEEAISLLTAVAPNSPDIYIKRIAVALKRRDEDAARAAADEYIAKFLSDDLGAALRKQIEERLRAAAE